VRKGADKLAKFLNSKQQGRLDGFFTVQPKTSPKKGASKSSGKDVKGKGKGKADTKGTKRKVCGIFFVWRVCYRKKLMTMACVVYRMMKRRRVGARRRRRNKEYPPSPCVSPVKIILLFCFVVLSPFPPSCITTP
jgi:hypothetical protein